MHNNKEIEENNDEQSYSYNTLDGINFAQRKVKSEICEIIWPGASNLTTFLLDVSNYENNDNNNNTEAEVDDDDDDEDLWIQHYMRTRNIPKYGTNPKILQHLILSLKHMLDNKNTKSSPLHIIELGAGIGYTGIKIATTIPSHVLLTDLDIAMSLLQKNINLNEEKFLLDKSVKKYILDWAQVKKDDDDKTINSLLKELYQWNENDSSSTNVTTERSGDNNSKNNSIIKDNNNNRPILLLAADCIYFSELHLPFEQVLQSILSKSPKGSMCVIASEKRWKRDNTFFVNFGKKTKTNLHSLQCFCAQENINFVVDDTNNDDEDYCASGSGRKKLISRIHIVQWLPISKK